MEFILLVLLYLLFGYIIHLFFKEYKIDSKKKNVFYKEDYIDLLDYYINFETDNLERLFELDLDTDEEYEQMKTIHIDNIYKLRNIKKIVSYFYSDKGIKNGKFKYKK